MRLLRDSLKILSLIAAIFLGSGVLALAEQRLALKGYDPVAYFTEKRAMLGDAQHQYNWDGSTYRFASTSTSNFSKPIRIATCRSTATCAPPRSRRV